MGFRHPSPIIAPHFTLQQKPLCVVATVTKLTEASTDLVLEDTFGSPFNLVVPYVIQTSLLVENTQCFSLSRLNLYKILLTHIYFYPLLYPLKTAPQLFSFPRRGKTSHLSCIYSGVFFASLIFLNSFTQPRFRIIHK